MAQISDLHLAAEPGAEVMGVDPRRQLRRVLADVARFRPDCILATGDLVHDGSPAGYRWLRRALAAFGCPVHAIPGNHDAPATLVDVLGPWPPVAKLGPWRLVLFDTHVPGRDSGAVGHAAPTAAARRLDAGPPGPVLAALHHPPVAVGSPWIDAMGLEDAAQFRRWAEARADLRLVVAGHVHQAARRRLGGAAVLTAPATSAQFTPRTAETRIEDLRPAWRALWLHPDGRYATRLRRLGPARGQPARSA